MIDHKLDEAIAKHCYLEKSKYEILPHIVISNIPSHMKYKKPDNSPNTIQHTIPMTPAYHTVQSNTTYISYQKHLSVLQKEVSSQELANRKLYLNFHNEIDDTELLKVNYD